MKRQQRFFNRRGVILSGVLITACLVLAGAEKPSTQPPSKFITEWWLHVLPLLHGDNGEAIFFCRSPQAVLVIDRRGEISSVHSIETGNGFTPDKVVRSKAATVIDDRLVCIAPGRSILSVNIKHGTVIKRAEELTAPVTSLAYDPKTKTLLAGLEDEAIVAFEVTGRETWKTKWRSNPPDPEGRVKDEDIQVSKWVEEGTFCVLGKGVRIVRASTGECLGLRFANHTVGRAFPVGDRGIATISLKNGAPEDLIVSYFNQSGDLARETTLSGQFCCWSTLPSTSELFMYSENDKKVLRFDPRTGEIHSASAPKELAPISIALKLHSDFLTLKGDHLFWVPLQFSPGR